MTRTRPAGTLVTEISPDHGNGRTRRSARETAAALTRLAAALAAYGWGEGSGHIFDEHRNATGHRAITAGPLTHPHHSES